MCPKTGAGRCLFVCPCSCVSSCWLAASSPSHCTACAQTAQVPCTQVFPLPPGSYCLKPSLHKSMYWHGAHSARDARDYGSYRIKPGARTKLRSAPSLQSGRAPEHHGSARDGQELDQGTDGDAWLEWCTPTSAAAWHVHPPQGLEGAPCWMGPASLNCDVRVCCIAYPSTAHHAGEAGPGQASCVSPAPARACLGCGSHKDMICRKRTAQRPRCRAAT